jgi:hypothetical protein
MNKSLIFTFAMVLLGCFSGNAQSEGTLTVTATTSSAGGNYAPKNIVAIWIEDNQGNFVKTLLAYAQTRKTHLNTWEASTTAAGSPFNTVDAITGATKSSHATRTCTWNGTDVNGTLVADGIYRIRMELTDKNSTGNYSTFTFTKGPDAENQSPANVPSFSSIILNWEPLATSVNDPWLEREYQVFPNPAINTLNISGQNILNVQVISQSGNVLYDGSQTVIDMNSCAQGVYYVKITTQKGIVTKKVMKK